MVVTFASSARRQWGFTVTLQVAKAAGPERQKLIPLDPILVAELSADHISGGQFRHGSRLLRWRTDKAPEDCRMDQIRLL